MIQIRYKEATPYFVLLLKKSYLSKKLGKMNKTKLLPYGVTDFKRLKTENFYFIDKTKYIEDIETSAPFLFLIRPCRFDKSLFLSMLESYYDIKNKNNFQELFGDTYIRKHPTSKRTSYLVLTFNFSSVQPDLNNIRKSFERHISLRLVQFIEKYQEIFSDEFIERFEKKKLRCKT